jgi:acid phosphatase type 7
LTDGNSSGAGSILRGVRALFFSIAFLIPSVALGQGVFRGPMLQRPTNDEISVVYESVAASTAVVRYGLAGALNQTVSSGPAAQHQELRLTGLAALGASEIHYELEVDGVVHPGTFMLPPAIGTAFRFVVYGDNRSSPAQHELVVDALELESPRPHFAINTGDLVSNGQREADWDAFFPVANDYLASMPIFVAIGNHEVSGTNYSVTARIFSMPTDVAPASNDEGFFHVIYGNVELIIINVESDNLYTVGFLQGDQEEWLTEVLGAPTAGVEHRFVFIHQGPYSSKVGRNGNFWMRQWLPDFADGAIDVLFSGHDHYAERGWAENGIPYVIHGGGGAPLYETQGPRVTPDHTIVHSESRLGYIVVDIDGPKARIQTKGLAGEVIDEFGYGDAAAPQCVQPSDCGPGPVTGCPGGSWACERSACRFVCGAGSGSLIACATDQACEDQLGANCTGTPTCQHPSINPLGWFCECVLPPDCSVDADCTSRPSPVPGCTGTWACVTDQCEFTTQICMPIDAGVTEDAGSAPDASDGGVDAAPPIDATITDAIIEADATISVDATTDAGDSGVYSVDAGAAPPEASGCGCSDTEPRGSSLLALLVFAFACAARPR